MLAWTPSFCSPSDSEHESLSISESLSLKLDLLIFCFRSGQNEAKSTWLQSELISRTKFPLQDSGKTWTNTKKCLQGSRHNLGENETMSTWLYQGIYAY